MSWIPIVSQVKSLVQAISGDLEGARLTQQEFADTCPVVSQVTSAVHWAKGDPKKARDTQKKFGKAMSSVADSIPVVGHAKGVIHYAVGDKEGGGNAMKAASRTTATVIGGGAGFLIGGPAGAYFGGVGGGQAHDAIATAVQSTIDGKLTCEGSWKSAQDVIHGDERGQRSGAAFDLAMTLTFDAFSGRAAGEAVRASKLPVRKDGKLDMRYKVNREAAGCPKGFKVNGEPDMRFSDASRNGTLKAKPVAVPSRAKLVGERVAKTQVQEQAKNLATLLRVAPQFLEEVIARTGEGCDIGVMTKTQVTAARACAMSYDDRKIRRNLDGYDYVLRSSTDEIGVWRHREKKLLLVAFRGSHTIRDFVVEDVAIVILQEDSCVRFASAEFMIGLLRDHPNHEVLFTGHSLGGRIAIRTAMRHPKRVAGIITFNEGCASRRVKLEEKLWSKLEVCRVPGDGVSANW
eukprot:CAMPEP_0184481100 /NCGR_PEP_ID=MMETSP0113_2-20130426/2636_1 /TAXON_ID=91329 /ORGANISM="Norrisiella sphaerica, Strain BC52" /LENGTH=460 /DNA_ID=CAMNT_0026860015 /DNA_START=279 /DNA_END=1658 /DNA_ORIENTATION=-